MEKNIILLFLLLFCPLYSFASFNDAVEQKTGWETLPRNRPFPILVADPREIRTALRKNSKDEIEADVGTYRSFVGWKGSVLKRESIVHFGLEGNGFFIMHHADARFPLVSSDGLIGLYLEAASDEWALQTRYTHISAHLSDDGIATGRTAIEYSREFFTAKLARHFASFGDSFIYAGYQYLTNTTPKDLPKHGGQIGFYSLLPWSCGKTNPYIGFDYKIRSAHEGSTWNATTGLALFSSQKNLGAPPIRFAFHYLKGHDPRGQFYGERIEKFSLGLELDL